MGRGEGGGGGGGVRWKIENADGEATNERTNSEVDGDRKGFVVLRKSPPPPSRPPPNECTNASNVHWKTLKHRRHYNHLLLLLLLLLILRPAPASLLRSLSFSVACLNAGYTYVADTLRKVRSSRSGCVISLQGTSAGSKSLLVPFEYSHLVVVVRPLFCVCSPSTSQQFRHLSFSFCIRAPLYSLHYTVHKLS